MTIAVANEVETGEHNVVGTQTGSWYRKKSTPANVGIT